MRKWGILVAALLVLTASRAGAQDNAEIIQPVDVYIRSVKIALKSKPPEYKRALKNLHLAREHYPDNYMVHFLLGSIWADKDEIDSMIVEYNLAEKYATPKEWKKVSKNLRKVMDSKWFEQFDRAVKLVNLSDSTEDQIQSIDDPKLADSMRWVLGETRRVAKEALRRATLLKPKDFRALSTRGLIYQREGVLDSSRQDFVAAESLFHRYELHDSTTNWYDTTVFFSGPDGKPTERFKEYRKKLKKLPDEKQTRYRNLLLSLISAYYESNMWPQTIALCRRYYGLDPDNINTIVTMADVFSRLGEENEALRWQEAVVRRDPGSKDTWYNMGIFYYNAAIRLQDSVTRYEKDLERDGNNKGLENNLHEYVKKRLNFFVKAVPRFQKVVEIDSKDKDSWRLLAICQFSIASLSDDLNTADDDGLSKAILDDVFGAGGYDRNAEWTDAENKLRKATEHFPDDQSLCRMMKVTLAQLRKIDELKTWTKKCP